MAGIINKPAKGGAFQSQGITRTSTNQVILEDTAYVDTPIIGGTFSSSYNTEVTVEQLKVEIADLVDTNVVAVEDQSILTYDEATDKWIGAPHTFTTVSSLDDVNDTARVDGSILTFDSSEDKYIATTTLDNQTIKGGSF